MSTSKFHILSQSSYAHYAHYAHWISLKSLKFVSFWVSLCVTGWLRCLLCLLGSPVWPPQPLRGPGRWRTTRRARTPAASLEDFKKGGKRCHVMSHVRALEHVYVCHIIIICPKKGVQGDTVFAFVKVKQSRSLATPFFLWLRHSRPHVCAHCAPLSVSDFRSRCNWWLGKSKDCTLWYEPVRIGWQLCQSYPTIAGKRAVHILLLEDAVRIRQPGNLVIG